MAGISHVASLALAAGLLGEEEDLLRELAIEMETEDGCIAVLGPHHRGPGRMLTGQRHRE